MNDAVEVDMVNHPPHYTSDPSGVECITITRHRNFNIGNAIKYLWRAGLKDRPTEPIALLLTQHDHSKEIEDLRKAVWYITDEIGRLEAARDSENVANKPQDEPLVFAKCPVCGYGVGVEDGRFATHGKWQEPCEGSGRLLVSAR